MDLAAIMTFWAENSDNILISIGVGFLFFVLGPLGVWFSGRRIRKERIEKAIELMIDLVEGMIVNRELITIEKLSTLFAAIEREVNVEVDNAYDLERLFGDVALRFQRSKHLDAQQKAEYASTLAELSQSLQEPEEDETPRLLPRRYANIFEDLEQGIRSDSPPAMKALEELREKLDRNGTIDGDPFLRALSVYSRLLRERPATLLIVIMFYILVLSYVFAFGPLT